MDNWEGAANELKDSGSSLSLCTCRICQTVKSREALISPCNCKGTLGKVHLSCLERWLNICGRQHCEICKFEFSAKRRRRYSVLQSVRIWASQSANRMLLRADVVAVIVLTSLTAALCSFSIFSMDFFVNEGRKLGLSPIYTRALSVSFQIVVVFGYLLSVYIVLRDHVVSWYAWWNSTMRIVILVEKKNTPVILEV
ncbi:E3 ubiquitin-protein ligase MARCH3-like isoform X2 [Cimex lectularius]|uniref:RING-CH-type domain-containing protein n=1 Tax=Cimex lectularius TaxID=79782 RepID=A0A8I6RH50_CIMLE|nr:E3 ubiquitin-protein ligase MARCH3-like isoform X2 [Cimex lectularius]